MNPIVERTLLSSLYCFERNSKIKTSFVLYVQYQNNSHNIRKTKIHSLSISSRYHSCSSALLINPGIGTEQIWDKVWNYWLKIISWYLNRKIFQGNNDESQKKGEQIFRLSRWSIQDFILVDSLSYASYRLFSSQTVRTNVWKIFFVANSYIYVYLYEFTDEPFFLCHSLKKRMQNLGQLP